jgi:FdhD protein
MTTQDEDGYRRHVLDRVAPDGGSTRINRSIAVETPVAIEINGFGYAVMMATPADLVDFAYGFAASERLIDDPGDVIDVDCHSAERGEIVRITLIPQRAGRVIDRVRHRVSESSCGLCGIENLEQAMRPLPTLAAAEPIAPAAIFRALDVMREAQQLNRETGAVHAALACDTDGTILFAREDVGRHNAFDKLIGAMARDGRGWRDTFALLSSRCSYELVEKAAMAGCATLVTVSAPTTLALSRAANANVTLLSLARPDSFLREPERG